MIAVALDRPWLVATLPGPMRLLSWAPHRPGFVTASRVVWREVRNADLGPDLDAERWLADEMAARGHAGDVGLLTSRDLSAWRLDRAETEGVRAAALATVGLGNAESVGSRLGLAAPRAGTVNVLVVVEAGLSEAAQIEALSIAVEARTAAIIEYGPDLATGRATGTGTDCLVLACRPGAARYAGLHTPVGEAVGLAVRRAVAQGVIEWRPPQAAAGVPADRAVPAGHAGGAGRS